MQYRGAVSAGGYHRNLGKPDERFTYTPGDNAAGGAGEDTLHSQQGMGSREQEDIEDAIQNRPFSFSSLPTPRTPGTGGPAKGGSGQLHPLAPRSQQSPKSSTGIYPINANPGIPPSSSSSSTSTSGQGKPGMPGSATGIAGGSGHPPSIKIESAPASSNNSNNKDDGNALSGGNASASGSGAGASGKPGKQGGASDFVKKLYRMLEEDSFKTIVTWGPKGDTFVVKDMTEFTKTVLPQHFKHSNFASFVRQLNKYDFHKVKNPDQNTDGTGENYWEFKHPNFAIDNKDSLETIKRKSTGIKKPDTPAASLGSSAAIASTPGGIGGMHPHPGGGNEVERLKAQIGHLTQNQQHIEMHLDRFTAQYQALMADLLGQHRAIAAQDAFTATTLQYIINLESRLQVLTHPGEAPVYPPSAEAQHLMITYSDLTRARYDKMTETTRRAEALGLFVNGTGLRRPDSPLEENSPEFARASLQQQQQVHAGYGMHAQQGYSSQPQPAQQRYGLSPLNQHQYALPQQQHSHYQQQASSSLQPLHPQGHPHQQPQHSYFTTQSLKQQSSQYSHSQDSPSSSGPSDSPHDSSSVPRSSFASFGEIRLSNRGGPGQQPQPHQQDSLAAPMAAGGGGGKPSDGGMSYFPAPGSAPIRPSTAITPGAVMVSTLNGGLGNGFGTGNGNGNSTPAYDSREESEDLETAANTSKNQSAAFLAEGEDIAAFAAALKGGQSSAAVRSALTSQPLIVRRATYIPGWSVPPRVLLVEDDPVCRNLTTKFLQLFGCTIEVAADGVEAVNKMQNGMYDICMMDISLPNLDGVSATSLIRQFDAMTPIISMTGNSRPDEVLTYFSHGMNDVLPKPFTKEGMFSMLEKHLIHLKQLHTNPDSAPMLDDINLNIDQSDPSVNPFQTLGISNEEYAALLSGSLFGTRTPSQSPGAGGATAGNSLALPSSTLGKRISEVDNNVPGDNETVKRTRFQDM